MIGSVIMSHDERKMNLQTELVIHVWMENDLTVKMGNEITPGFTKNLHEQYYII